MRPMLRLMALASVVTIGSGLAIGTSSAKAQGHDHGGHHQQGGYNGGGYGGGYYGGGYGVPSYGYYGNGGHDAAPHWHNTQTPFGSFSYYGTGRHDYRPHPHTVTPYGITSYSGGRFRSTQSYSPPTPYYYSPW